MNGAIGLPHFTCTRNTPIQSAHNAAFPTMGTLVTIMHSYVNWKVDMLKGDVKYEFLILF